MNFGRSSRAFLAKLGHADPNQATRRKWFDAAWPDLNRNVNDILATARSAAKTNDYAELRSDRDLLEEVLKLSRQIERDSANARPRFRYQPRTFECPECGNRTPDAAVFKVRAHNRYPTEILTCRHCGHQHDILPDFPPSPQRPSHFGTRARPTAKHEVFPSDAVRDVIARENWDTNVLNRLAWEAALAAWDLGHKSGSFIFEKLEIAFKADWPEYHDKMSYANIMLESITKPIPLKMRDPD
ncbi:MAG: hypothetical protein R3B49_04975 [Phycisphaerales bacterium]